MVTRLQCVRYFRAGFLYFFYTIAHSYTKIKRRRKKYKFCHSIVVVMPHSQSLGTFYLTKKKQTNTHNKIDRQCMRMFCCIFCCCCRRQRNSFEMLKPESSLDSSAFFFDCILANFKVSCSFITSHTFFTHIYFKQQQQRRRPK